MLSRSPKYIIVAVMMFLVMAFISCGSEVDVDDGDTITDTIATELDAAKALLSQGLYLEARQSFQYILEELDPENREAMFGWNISKTLETVNKLVETAIELVDFLVGTGLLEKGEVTAEALRKAVRDPEFESVTRSGIGSFFESALKPYELDAKAIDENFEKIIANPEGFEFRIESLPIIIGPFSSLANIGGEYDLGEVHTFAAVAKALRAIFDVVIALDYTLDLFGIAAFLIDVFPTVEEWDADTIIGLICYLLNENPLFLGINAEDGVPRMQDAGNLLGLGADHVVKLVEEIKNDAVIDTDQSDDIIGFALIEGEESLVISFDIESNPFVEVTAAEDSDLIIPLSESITSSFSHIRDNLLGQGNRMSWADDFVPLISLTLVALLNTGIVQAVLESVLADMGDSDMLNQILNPALLSESLISGLLTSVIPGVLEFDMHAYFTSPTGPRDFLPAISTIHGGLEDKMLLEFECTYEDLQSEESLLPGFICPNDVVLYDGPHFPGWDLALYNEELPPLDESYLDDLTANGITQIASDGIDNNLPYIPFISPSFGNILYLDVDILALDGYSGFMLADNRSLNATIANIAGGLVSTIGSLF
jgi:hypothetical protein